MNNVSVYVCVCKRNIQMGEKCDIWAQQNKNTHMNDVTIVVVLQLGLSPTLSCSILFILPNMFCARTRAVAEINHSFESVKL